MISAALLCLALNVYGEARGESPLGQLAVAHVTLNRAEDPAYPDDVCAVVFEDRQFSWTASPTRIREPGALIDALFVANTALRPKSFDPTSGATHFYSGSKAPSWAARFRFVGRIGAHRFFVKTDP